MSAVKYSLLSFVLILVACSGDTNDTADANDDYVAEAWADNWFAMYIGEQLIIEDSVPILTERSFNAERYSFSAPSGTVLSFVLKDYTETNSGLEYIGESRQQMGDGGFIAQVFDQRSGDVLLVSDGTWKCTVVHQAPLNKGCESSGDPDRDCQYLITGEPDGWKAQDFDDSGWQATTEHRASEVDPKGGYDDISWDSSAKLIWGEDLESDNSLLCRTSLP